MGMLKRVLWYLTAIGGLAALAIMIHTFIQAQTAQEQAECSTVAIACVVIPYCLARAVAEATKAD